MKRCLLGLSLCLLLSWAQAESLLTGVQARLINAPLLRGAFEQQKTLRGFQRPLVSSGDFLLWRDHGILWNTRQPFAASLLLTAHSLRARQGEASYQLTTSQEPGLATINQLLFALLSGDLADLEQHFVLQGELSDVQHWQLRLTPSDPTLAAMFREIQLQGGAFVEQVQLDEVNGDSSLIRFTQLSQTPAASADEVARFAE